MGKKSPKRGEGGERNLFDSRIRKGEGLIPTLTDISPRGGGGEEPRLSEEKGGGLSGGKDCL